jgi:hypothetical protein
LTIDDLRRYAAAKSEGLVVMVAGVDSARRLRP